MKYTRESIIERYNSGEKMNIIAFWGHTPNPKKMTKACFSQWYNCRFKIDGVQYHTAEQYMMAQKAVLMGDKETCAKIMASDNPKDYKALGRLVRNFDPKLWDQNKYDVVLKGNIAKFSQNPELFAFLDSTGNSILVEGSPYDSIWGVKLGIEDERINDPNQWRGENLLGFALMETRDVLRNEPDIVWDDVEWNSYDNECGHHDGDWPEYSHCSSSTFMKKENLWGLLRDDGSILFYPQWDNCEDMQTGYTVDRSYDDLFEYGLPRNEAGVLDNTYYFVRVRKGGKYGVVDTAGREITPCKWDEIDQFGNARQGELWGFVNLVTCEETRPQWKENQGHNPYKKFWYASVPKHELMNIGYRRTMTLFKVTTG